MLQPKPIQLLWVVGGVIFMLALVHSLSGGQATEWVSSTLAHGRPGGSPYGGEGRASLRQHMALAEKSWAKTVRQRHELLEQDWPGSDNITMFPSVDEASYRVTPYSIWDFVPASYGCPHEMERIGRMGDGGKWVCGMSLYENLPADKPCIIYSFGVQNESSFEDEMLDRTHCEIWAYDYSVVDFGKQLKSSNREMAHFTQAGISGTTNTAKVPPFYSIQDLMTMNGHDYIDILKIDIEFSEFESLASLDEAFPVAFHQFPIGQMLIEIHLFGPVHARVVSPQAYYAGAQAWISSGQFLSWWEMLESRGLRPSWTEPNLLYTTLNIEDFMPRLAEYTFINVKDFRNILFEALNG